MSDVVIKVENLSKKYILAHQNQERYTALRDVMVNGVRKMLNRGIVEPLKRLSSNSTPQHLNSSTEDFYALKDVSFEIKQGDRVGIIGRNGAGKSTLLKILSRITEPSSGRIEITGRVASLLEVGTGFHPELTGRENIFLNGAILGMGREELKRKFDEIVAFAEVEKFLDTPVKRYSSGMYVRLAFAVAAHLEPEILIVDEVLAVGDAQFQKKCLGKMAEVGREGRTVLFVSHNMQAIRNLCDRAILFNSGNIIADDDTSKVIACYLQEVNNINGISSSLEEVIHKLPPDPTFKLDGVTLLQCGHSINQFIENGKPLEVIINYRILERVTGLRVYFDLYDDQETLLFRSFHDENSNGIPIMDKGCYISKVVIPANILGPINYDLRIKSGIFNVRHCLPEDGITIAFKVEHTGSYNRAYMGDTFRGKLALALEWETMNCTNDHFIGETIRG